MYKLKHGHQQLYLWQPYQDIILITQLYLDLTSLNHIHTKFALAKNVTTTKTGLEITDL